MYQISKAEARNFLVHYHNLTGEDECAGEGGVLHFVKKIGSIQFDPLNVVGRNADLVLQSRIKNYTPSILEKLLYESRSLIDGWDKQMAIYCQEDFPLLKRIRIAKEIETRGILAYRKSLEALDYLDDVRHALREKGPLQANQISIGVNTSTRWGHKKISSAVLDYLFQTGELGVCNKRNTQKVYDFVENIYSPENILPTDPFQTDDDFYKWYFKRRVGSTGLIWGKSGGGWYGCFVSDKKLREKVLAELCEDRQILKINIDGISEPFYLRAEDESYFNKGITKCTVRFLAPLDNMLWDRAIVEKIFDFKYSWEVYIPQSKRQFGYYVLPVLYGNKLIARFEPEKNRKGEPLVIKNWWWEKSVERTEDMCNAIDVAFERFQKYLNVKDVKVVNWRSFI